MKVSIVTVNFNDVIGLEATIKSVLGQTGTAYEFILIDGGSTDGSAELVKKYSDRVAVAVSEPDRGIYHAMNKGILKSSGDYLIFMNSGDCFHSPDTLQQAVPFLDGTDLVYGDIIQQSSGSEQRVTFNDNDLSFWYFLGYNLPHQATFNSKRIMNADHLYDENLRIVSDWKFYMNAILSRNVSFRHIDLVIARCDNAGISNSNTALSLQEREQVLEKDYRLFMRDFKKNPGFRDDYNVLINSRYIRGFLKIRKKFLSFFRPGAR